MEVTTEVILTPEQMAQAFWEMDDIEQSEFFEHLGRITAFEAGGADLQWYYLGRRLQGNDLARSTLMSLAAPLFWHTLNYMEK